MKTFPIQRDFDRTTHREVPASTIPWGLIAPHDEQAKKNHAGQDLVRLAERFGLSHCEAVAIIEDRPWHRMDLQAAIDRLAELVADYKEPSINPKT